MSTRQTLFVVLLVAIIGWIGLGYFTYTYAPTLWARLVFLGLLLPIAFTTLTPVAYYLHRRFSRSEDSRAVLSNAMREAGLLAGLLVVWAGLRMINALNWAWVLVMSGVVVLVEVVTLLRR